ncbi:tRNA(m5U54)methyltransferase [Rhizophlyctis rosea]|uniref:Trimethylguanosine synthase n=1 Tax=Rhizophlyctis rosea TaxID=64517 RepID=A0AAD5SAF9_9FUNG|nr:tRNA(m5U54)methyltransferase [Rhizophlyctis rosea]
MSRSAQQLLFRTFFSLSRSAARKSRRTQTHTTKRYIVAEPVPTPLETLHLPETHIPKLRRSKRYHHVTPHDKLLPADIHLLVRSQTEERVPILDPSITEKDSPYEYHDEVVIRIFAVSPSSYGVGLGKNNWLVVVPNGLEGELIKAKVYKDLTGWSVAEVVEILERHPERAEPKCKYFNECSGCGYQHLSYKEQLRRKKRMVEKVFAGEADSLRVPVEQSAMLEAPTVPLLQDVVKSPREYGYRTKLSPHFGMRQEGQLLEAIGYNARGRANSLVDVDYCPIGTDAVNKQYAMERNRLLGTIAMRKTLGATLMFRNNLIPPPDHNVTSHNETRDITSLTPKPWPPEGWSQTATATHKATVLDSVNDFLFRFPANSFWQTNSSILPHLTSYIRSQLRKHGLSTITPTLPAVRYLIDAYCGAGLFAITCSRDFERVVGIEVDPASLAWAQINAKDNAVDDKVKFIGGDVKDIFGSLEGVPADESAVIIDPPAKGCGSDFMRQLLELGPRIIIYVSCNVHSQVGDLKTLVEEAELGMLNPVQRPQARSYGHAIMQERESGGQVLLVGGKRWRVAADGSYEELNFTPVKGYRIMGIQPFDMFPQTVHVENVVTLVREDGL